MKRVITTEDIRRWAMALPEVTEKSHFRFKVPVFQVSGKTFLGMGRHEDTAIFCIPEDDAEAAATADPDTYKSVRRTDARHSFLGLQVRLDGLDRGRAQELVDQSWRHQAPKRLISKHS
jgi:hypothetical protein